MGGWVGLVGGRTGVRTLAMGSPVGDAGAVAFSRGRKEAERPCCFSELTFSLSCISERRMKTRSSRSLPRGRPATMELPLDVLSMIFTRLPTLECVASAHLVSKRWHEATIASSKILWTQLAVKADITNAVPGGVLDFLGVGWKGRYLMQLSGSRPSRTAEELNTAFEFYIESGNDSFAMVQEGTCDLAGKPLGVYVDDAVAFGAPRRISIQARVVSISQFGCIKTIFQNNEEVTFGFKPYVHAVYARRRADGAVACVFQTAIDLDDEPDFYMLEGVHDGPHGTFGHHLRGGKTVCPGARSNESLDTSAGFEMTESHRKGQTQELEINWSVPFKKGMFKLDFAWQHYDAYGQEVGFDDISATMLWDALNPQPEWKKRGPFFM